MKSIKLYYHLEFNHSIKNIDRISNSCDKNIIHHGFYSYKRIEILTSIYFSSQVTIVGTRVLQGIRAVDIDQQGPFSTVQYSVLPGSYSVCIQYFKLFHMMSNSLIFVNRLS